MRILVSGMGGELGTRVAQLLEADPAVSAVVGLDIDPPRHRLRRATFHRIHPNDRERTDHLVRAVDPEVLVHLGVYEPDARATPSSAERRTQRGAQHVLGAAASCRSLRAVVVRSGTEVYGRGRSAPVLPDESAPTVPTTPFGRSLLEVEQLAVAVGVAARAPVTRVRLAPVVGAHFPSPLGRLLRQRAVPWDPVADGAFGLVHTEDAARAVVAAVTAGVDGPVNVGGRGMLSTWQAIRLGSRLPVPVVAAGWWVTPTLSSLFGAPIPPHVAELLRRGRGADVSSCASLLGRAPELTTIEVVKELYAWASVTSLPLAGAA